MLDTERVAALRDQGLSLRDIAKTLSTSLAAVQRALARRPAPEPEPDDDDDLIAMLDAMDARATDAEDITPPIIFTGLKPVPTPISGIDTGPPVMSRTYSDAVGHELDELDLYRCRQWLESQGRWDEAEALERTIAEQMDEIRLPSGVSVAATKLTSEELAALDLRKSGATFDEVTAEMGWTMERWQGLICGWVWRDDRYVCIQQD